MRLSSELKSRVREPVAGAWALLLLLLVAAFGAAAAARCTVGGAASCTSNTDTVAPAARPGHWGAGGELQQDGRAPLTTSFGAIIDDDENSLKANAVGPTLLEDVILREKITHFDHESIPDRVVHARGSAAHGYFEVTNAKFIRKYCKSAFLQKDGEKTDVFVRFSTVLGGRGSVDLPRDVRGFAVRFYTTEGNWDLVGNNIPVFFIQDSIKFPDLIHAAKMEPDRGFPQDATAHETFWDFIAMMPESMHMIQWAMSDRTIPRSYRTMQGFGVHTFRLIAADESWTYVKFHWRPVLGTQSVVWDEAVKINGADPDFHRRDLWEAIDTGDFPEWELGVQVFGETEAETFGFDHLDSTKFIPEEMLPVTYIGKMVLNRNPENFFAETEQVAYHLGNIVPGIDFTNDPLLHGRLHSYVDTQLTRLGGPNYQQLPINKPRRCPVFNFQRDGFMRYDNPKGRIHYSPSSLVSADAHATTKERTVSTYGINALRRAENGFTTRSRSPSFSDHYTQARIFYLSQTETEQNHMVVAYVLELSRVETVNIRRLILSHLLHVDETLAARVAMGLGIPISEISPAPTATPPKEVTKDMLAPSLSIIANAPNNTVRGRQVGCLITDGTDAALLKQLQKTVVGAGAKLKLIAPRMGPITLSHTGLTSSSTIEPDFFLTTAPSELFDAVLVLPSALGAQQLLMESAALDFLSHAWSHLKVIGHSTEAAPLLGAAHINTTMGDAGLIELSSSWLTAGSVGKFASACMKLKIWEREPTLRNAFKLPAPLKPSAPREL